MKHVILHYFFILYLYNVQVCATAKRYRFRKRHYDINGFISQLLASSKFDELAEKLAEKAANKIIYFKEEPAAVDRANDNNEVQNNTETTTENSQTQSEGKYEKEYLRNGFIDKIDPNAVMNATSLSENLMLKYKILKKNALESKIRKERDMVSKNVTNEEGKENKTMEPVEDKKNEKERKTPNENTTQRNEDGVKKELFVETTSSRGITFTRDDQKVEPQRNIEPNFVHDWSDGERKESSQKNGNQPKEPSLGFDEGEKIFRVQHNSAAEPEEKEAIKVNKGINEEIPSSLDVQNRNYSPSEENAGAEVERIEDERQPRGQEEITDRFKIVGHGAYFRGREDSIEENLVPRYETPHGGTDKSVGSNDSGATGGRGSHERFPEDHGSTENENVDPAKPVNRTEGDKVYTYNQASDYQDYHEEMAKWKKKHPENPADFM